MSSDDEIIAAAREGFLDEARDMLRQFEEGLLAIENDPNDTEALNSAFRAAHTIKGTAGLFGFDAVVKFTHEVESVMDAMRDGSLAVSEQGMALLLQGRDQMDRLLAEVGQEHGSPEVAQRSTEIGTELRQLLGGKGSPPAGAATAEPAAAAAGPAASGLWHISLLMGEDALRNGLDPLSFIRYLDSLGSVAALRTLTHRLPELGAMDAESCYLGFEIRLQSEATRKAIEDVFEFLREDCRLVVLAPDAAPAEYEALLAAHAADAAQRDAMLAAWRALEVPFSPAAVDRRTQGQQAPDTANAAEAADNGGRRLNEPERRGGSRDRRGADEARFIRVRADKLDRLIDLIGELVIASSGAQLVAQTEQSPRFAEAALRIHDLVQDARDGALGLRMVPIGETFTRFQRVVRDVSKQLGKDVELQISGGDTEMDKSMVETIADPLMHLVRNSLDHGIESPEERGACSKPSQGRLGLHAYHESGSIVIEVSDDGRGLNRERILAKAVERGLVASDAVLDDQAIYQLIFAPGFSTADQVTNISGRGVGMDVVKRNIDSLRGQIKIASTPGRGATMQIRLPLTLAIIDGFLTSVGGVSYVLPLEIVAECIEMPSQLETPSGQVAGCFDLRGEVVPYIDLRRCFGHAGARPPRQSLIVVRTGATKTALLVDRLLGEYQTVIKPLAPMFQNLPGLAGSTILGSGEVALILDVPALERQQAAQRPGVVLAH